MPRTVNTGVYDATLAVAGCPNSAEEYDEMAKQVGACLDTAVDNDLQHIWKGAFRKKLRAKIEEIGVAAEEGEKDKAHYDRAKALIGSGDGPIDLATFVALRQEVADTVDYSTGGGSSSRIGQTWLDKASSYLEQIQDPGSWTAFMENISAANPGYSFDLSEDGATPTQESIALALKTEDARVRQAAEGGLFAAAS